MLRGTYGEEVGPADAALVVVALRLGQVVTHLVVGERLRVQLVGVELLELGDVDVRGLVALEQRLLAGEHGLEEVHRHVIVRRKVVLPVAQNVVNVLLGADELAEVARVHTDGLAHAGLGLRLSLECCWCWLLDHRLPLGWAGRALLVGLVADRVGLALLGRG